MSLAELVITSVKLEGRTKSEVARDYRVSRFWVHQLVRRFELEGEAAFAPRSKRPLGNSRAISLQVEDRIIRLRKELARKGLDAGAETIRVHLQHELGGDAPLDPGPKDGPDRVPAVSTDLADSGPSWVRDATATQAAEVGGHPVRRGDAERAMAGGRDPLAAGRRNRGGDPEHRGRPLPAGCGLRRPHQHHRAGRAGQLSGGRSDGTASRRGVLTDNAAVFTGKPRGGGRVALELELDLLGVKLDPEQVRFHQTQKKSARGP
jgi:hypothetical protein